jgi:hypothetical protein
MVGRIQEKSTMDEQVTNVTLQEILPVAVALLIFVVGIVLVGQLLISVA